MNILVLHNLEDIGRARRSTLDYIFAFERYQPGHTYHHQKITDPPPAEVAGAHWDAVILGSTSLGIVTIRPRELYLRIRDRWDFLKDEKIIKIAFPQDDANCGGLMDDWFSDWSFQLVYSVRVPEHWPVLYPKSSRSAQFLPCLSGYIDDNTLPELKKHAKPWKKRERLIGQRVTMYLARGGRQGRLKGLMAEAVKAAALARGLKADISTDSADTFFGDSWYDFLGDCKFVLGTEGGLSLHDPYGEIADRIAAFTAANPRASFEEIEAACFAGLDGLHVFSGFSPRVLEAAVSQSSQVLVEGHYLGALEPDTHYLCLKQDLSNLDAVLDGLGDEKAAQRRIKACNEALVENPDFRFSSLAVRVIAAIAERAPAHGKAKPFDAASARRGYVTALAREARSEGFRWPELGDRVAAQVARQQLPEGLRGASLARAGLAARVQVLAAEIDAVSAAAAAGSPAALLAGTLGNIARALETALLETAGQALPPSIETAFNAIAGAFEPLRLEVAEAPSPRPLGPALSMIGYGAADADFLDGLSGLPPEGELARFATAAATAPETAGLATRLAPGTGAQFSPAEVARLEQIDRLIVGAGEGGLDQLEDFLARRDQAAPLMSALADGGDTARFLIAVAGDRQSLTGLASRLAPRSGEAFSADEIARLQQLDELVVRTADNGLDAVFRQLAHGPRAEPLVAALERGGDTARLILALAGGEAGLIGIASRLAPRSGEAFSAAEIARLQQLDELVVRTADTGLDALFRQLAHGPRAEALVAALERGGDTARLILALAGDEAGLLGIASRLAPRSGEAFSAEEVQQLKKLDSLIAAVAGRPLDEVASDLLAEPERQCLVALRADPDMAAMVQHMLQVRAQLSRSEGPIAEAGSHREVAGGLDPVMGQAAPGRALAGSETEAASGVSPDVTRARFQVLSAVVGTPGKRDEQIKAAAEVLNWPTSGLALLVIEASSRLDMDPIAADENIDTLRQVGQVLACGGIRPALISLIVGRNSKRND